MAANETIFEVAGPMAARFLEAVGRTAEEGDDVEIVAIDGAPREEQRQARRDAPRNYAPSPGPHKPKPYRHAGSPEKRETRPEGRGPKPFHRKGGPTKHRTP